MQLLLYWETLRGNLFISTHSSTRAASKGTRCIIHKTANPHIPVSRFWHLNPIIISIFCITHKTPSVSNAGLFTNAVQRTNPVWYTDDVFTSSDRRIGKLFCWTNDRGWWWLCGVPNSDVLSLKRSMRPTLKRHESSTARNSPSTPNLDAHDRTGSPIPGTLNRVRSVTRVGNISVVIHSS